MTRREFGPPIPPHTTGKFETRVITPVVALRNRDTGEEVSIGDGRTVIGKSPTCDVVLGDPCVSRLHCVLERREGVLYVRDRGSRNGTYINDRRVDCGELPPGAELTVGATRFLALGPRVGSQRGGFDRLTDFVAPA